MYEQVQSIMFAIAPHGHSARTTRSFDTSFDQHLCVGTNLSALALPKAAAISGRRAAESLPNSLKTNSQKKSLPEEIQLVLLHIAALTLAYLFLAARHHVLT